MQFDQLKRREFITLLGGVTAALPLAARAQQADRMRRIGVLMPIAADDPQAPVRIAAFLQGLAQFGWTDGRNVRIEYRWGAGDAERIRKYAAELVALAPDVILAWAPQPWALPVVGFLHAQSPDAYTEPLRGFRQGLRETGYVEGETVAIEYRWAESRMDRLPALAAELVHRKVDLIAATGGHPSAIAAKAATTTIPIVFIAGDDLGWVEGRIFATVSDPIGSRLVTSFARPGGNITGFTSIEPTMPGKWLELLKEIAPRVTRDRVRDGETSSDNAVGMRSRALAA